MSQGTARSVAHAVLLRVASDDAWAERVLGATLERHDLPRRERALATELVYGTLRHQRWLDFLLGQLARKPLTKLPDAALAALRLTAFQIVASRVPDYSAVNEGVSLVRRRHPRLAGMANAVLRKLADHNQQGALPEPADLFGDPIEALAVRTSHPTWLVRQVAAEQGESEARDWTAANNTTPAIPLRVNAQRTTREELAAELQEAGVEVTTPEDFPDSLLIKGGGIARLPGFAEGLFVVQDPGAGLVSRLAAPRAGEVWLDACAAPGTKSTHLAELMADTGRVVAMDIHRGKTRLIAANAERLGLGSLLPVAGDATELEALRDALALVDGAQLADGVLLDAPCSGSGTLRRNPELRVRLGEDLGPTCARQDALLASVARILKPGGVLVYAVCSVLRAEGEERVEHFLAEHPELALERPADRLVASFADEAGYVRTWPQRHGCDGFFAARLVRKG